MDEQLYMTYLRFDKSTKYLSEDFLCQAILNIIYDLGNPKIKEILGKIKVIIGETFNNKKIVKILKKLQKEKKISTSTNRGVVLNQKINLMIKERREQHKNRFNEVICKYFTQTETDVNLIKNWFNDVTIKFFNKYWSKWLEQSYNHKYDSTLYDEQLPKILEESFNDNDNDSYKIFADDKDWLKEQYLNFMKSNDSDANELLLDYGTSMFASTILSANSYADPLTIDLLKDSIFILDNNVTMYLKLDNYKLADSLKKIENIFLKLNIKLAYFYISLEEYNNAISYMKEQLVENLKDMPMEVLHRINDPFINESFFLGCSNKEDFERFFNDLLIFPEYFKEIIPIEDIRDNDLETAIKKGQQDKKLIDELNAIYKIKKKENKSLKKLIHDAGLISGSVFLANSDKYWLLTNDNVINDYMRNHCLRNRPPISFNIETLINVLAINDGGIGDNTINCATLFANIIKNKLFPEKKTLQVEDLVRVNNIKAQISELPPASILKITNEFIKDRLEGKSEDLIKVQIDRNFQSEVKKIMDQLEDSKEYTLKQIAKREKIEKINSNLLRKKKKELKDKYDKEYEDKYSWEKLTFFVFYPFLTICLSFFITFLILTDISNNLGAFLISFLANIAFWLFSNIFKFKPDILEKYNENIRQIDKKVEAELNEYINDNDIIL